MLKRLLVKNFTVFAEADFEFGPGLNVVVGTNGTGKSHVLKLGYVLGHSATYIIGDEWLVQDTHNWQNQVSRDFQGVFRPERIGSLVRQGADSAFVEAKYEAPQLGSIALHFSEAAQGPVKIGQQPIVIDSFLPEDYSLFAPVFIPPKEVLSMFPGLQSFYNKYELSLEQTYPDLCALLELPVRRAPEAYVLPVIAALEQIMGGRIKLENGRFYFYQDENKAFVIDLAAEGIRKLATLAQLLINDSLTPETTLFWDEPEANLNPALLRKLAAVLTDLASQGFQIMLATHSLFLLKELHVLAQQQKSKVRYFGLYSSPAGDTRVEQTDDLETLNHLTALDEELAQTARFQRVLNEDFFQPES
jgi:energy-coupling factor transporter ATP-binding protein EcfA2